MANIDPRYDPRFRDIENRVLNDANSEQRRIDARARLRQGPVILGALFLCAVVLVVIALFMR